MAAWAWTQKAPSPASLGPIPGELAAQAGLRLAGQQAQPTGQAVKASFMIRLMARAQRPHRILQPRQP